MSTSPATASMRKSVLLLSAAALAPVAVGALLASTGVPLAAYAAAACVLAGISLLLLAQGGRIAMRRQTDIEQGRPDAYLADNHTCSEAAVIAGRAVAPRLLRSWPARKAFGHRLVVGDSVMVKPLAGVRATLDQDGCVRGLPFMPEMERFCGRSARVYRVLDKIYDYGRSRQMRRLDDAVLLVGLRCDGSAHGSCEAECYLIWRSEWLEPLGYDDGPLQDSWPPTGSRAGEPAEPGWHWNCQYTQLSGASTASMPLSLRSLLAPWASGNVSTGAWWTAILTRAFNAFQSWRGGQQFPSMPAPGNDKTVIGETVDRGDWVRIRTPAEIARTLDRNSKNKGLWFDRDMLKNCGQTFQVRSRVRQIVDIGSGAIIAMKTPCIMLDDVHYSGEFQGFGEQHDFLYWREAWLQPVVASTDAPRIPADA